MTAGAPPHTPVNREGQRHAHPAHSPNTCSNTTCKGLPEARSHTTRIQGLWAGYQLVHLSPAGAEPLSRTATWRPDCRPVSSLFQQCRPPSEDFARAMLPLQANTLCLWVIRWRNTLCVLSLECPSPHSSRRALPVDG